MCVRERDGGEFKTNSLDSFGVLIQFVLFGSKRRVHSCALVTAAVLPLEADWRQSGWLIENTRLSGFHSHLYTMGILVFILGGK